MPDVTAASLPYHEPSIVTILVLCAFALGLNIIGHVLDRLIYCGLVGQILVGVAFGQPGGKLLSAGFQDTVVQLGYLGLILLVYEGGLSTSIKALRKNLPLSSAVALTGIAAPIALSFVLLKMLPITPLQAFAAGAALCSTSLGTTFTILNTSGLSTSRLGIVLTSAAMLDDVVGLIMVQVISVLGTSSSSFNVVTVIRPVFVSIAFAVIVPLLCRFVVQPLAARYGSKDRQGTEQFTWVRRSQTAFVVHTAVLLAFVVASSYAGTSNLFAAYLAGASISWYDGLEPVAKARSTKRPEQTSTAREGTQTSVETSPALAVDSRMQAEQKRNEGHEMDSNTGLNSGKQIYTRYYEPAVKTVLKPFFFASIGFSIPITQMFTGPIVWRGVVYTLLMIFGKVLCGVWLIRIANPLSKSMIQVPARRRRGHDANVASNSAEQQPSGSKHDAVSTASGPAAQASNTSRRRSTRQKQGSKSSIQPPRSLYPASILSCAMVARGEIGFLISAVAQSTGLYDSSDAGGAEEVSSDLFLVVTWAVLLCTVLGPVVVGLLVKRVKRLQSQERDRRTGKEDPLGIWGVVQ